MFDGKDSPSEDDRSDDNEDRSQGGSIPTQISSGLPMSPKERPRGILSQTDREYLCGLKEYKHEQSEANRRQDIRKRVKNGLEDFILLWLLLSDDDRNQLFSEMGTELVDISIESAIAFLYLGVGRESDRIEALLEKGIYLGANSGSGDNLTGEVTDVQVSIDIERNPNVEKIKKKMNKGRHDELTPAEIGVLVRKG